MTIDDGKKTVNALLTAPRIDKIIGALILTAREHAKLLPQKPGLAAGNSFGMPGCNTEYGPGNLELDTWFFRCTSPSTRPGCWRTRRGRATATRTGWPRASRPVPKWPRNTSRPSRRGSEDYEILQTIAVEPLRSVIQGGFSFL